MDVIGESVHVDKIYRTFLVVNLSKLLRQLLSLFLSLFPRDKTFELKSELYIIKNYINIDFIQVKLIDWEENYRTLAA